MRTMKFALGVLVLLAGCLVVLLPGILTKPGTDETFLSLQESGETLEESLEALLGQSGDSDDSANGSLSESVSKPESTPSDMSEVAEEADYGTVFPDEEIQRIDLVIGSEDWQAMLAEVAGAGVERRIRDIAGVPEALPIEAPQSEATERPWAQAFADACADCEEGDELTLSLGFGEVSGTCVRSGDRLVFQPSDELAERAPGGMQAQRGGVPPEGMQRPGLRAEGGALPSEAEVAPPGGVGFEAAPGGLRINQTADATLSYVECTVLFDGEVWEHVGVRFKGNSTLRATAASGSWKYPFHLDFDEFEEIYPETTDQRFFGFDDLSLSNGATDSSLLRDLLPAEIFRAFGVPTPEMAYYQIYLDIGDGPMFLGVYTVVETPDDPMLEAMFGSSDGNLYKPQGQGATWAAYDEAAFVKKSNDEEEDWSDVEAAFEALHASRDDAAAWREGLEAVFDVDGFLRWLAINQLLGNWDAYGQMAQNYYLYSDPSDGLIHWIPWDLNQSLNTRMQRAESSMDPRSDSDEWPLIHYVLADPVYFDVYTEYVADALDTVYDEASLGALVMELQEMLVPCLVDEEGDLSVYSFVSSVDEMTQEGARVLEEIGQRIAEAEAFLEEQAYERTAIVITEIHYNPNASEGSDGAGEFIELMNRSDAAVDLSGYRFDDGIYYTFRAGTTLDAGECLILAKDASCYSGTECRVLQWDRGNLSNEGEVLRLLDAEGYWVDRVAYMKGESWEEICDGDGRSLSLIDGESANHVAGSWASSARAGGSPGVAPDVD